MSDKSTITKSKSSMSPIQETKLFGVLSTFNAYELNRFDKFLSSPYFNRNDTLTALFRSIESLVRQNRDDITRSAIWNSVFDVEEYDDAKFRKLCSNLLKLIERFLAQEAFEKNSLHKADYLLQAINEKQLEPLVKSSIRTAQRLSDQYFFRPASYYYYQYAFQREIFSLSGLNVDRTKVANVDKIALNLDRFYLAEKLRYYCDILSRKLMIDRDYELLFMEDIIQHVRQHGYQDEVPINIYFQIYLTHTEPENVEHYGELKKLINTHILKLPELEAKQVIDAALNYCINKINEGRSEFIRETFELYIESLQKELLFINGYITPWTFRNVIVSGLRLSEFEWVEKFIRTYSEHIEKKYRDNAVSFNLANLYFYKKEYDRVIEQLQEVEYDDPSYNLNSKTMLMFTYYETDEIDPLLSLISSFTVYLRRNKQIPQNRKTHYLNLIKFLRSLVRTPVNDKEGLTKLEQKIHETPGVVNKNWLLDKIRELKG